MRHKRKVGQKCLLVFMAVTMPVMVGASLNARGRVQREKPRDIQLGSLKQVPIPEPVNLADFVKDKSAAVALGKALFWDMQVGSSGAQACASCHFHAGADIRVKNNVSPGLLAGDVTFQLPGPNGTVTPAHFPLTKFLQPDQPGFENDPNNTLVHSFNDAMSSQGVRHFQFVDIILGEPFEKATPVDDPTFTVSWRNVRRVEPRNSPTVINSVFNFSNFWDGRARNIFNGVNPFGELDESARVYRNNNGSLDPTIVRIPDASLASQAVGPPGSDFEMSSIGRTFPKIGKKLLSLRPLGQQWVHPQDSVLGPLARHWRGLNTNYAAMIKAAFQDPWWNDTTHIFKFEVLTSDLRRASSNDHRISFAPSVVATILSKPNRALHADEFTQIEANFSLFFGLAVMLYESTLVSDDSKFDRVMEGNAAFTQEEQEGFDIFMNQGRCINCHSGAEFTNHSVRNVRNQQPAQAPGFLPNNIIEFMDVANRQNVIYDNGIYNIGVRPAGSNIQGDPGFVANNEDVGRGGTAPFNNPLTGEPYPLSIVRLAKLKAQNLLPSGVAKFIPDLPNGVPANNEVAVDGAQKTKGLRNIDLTGPYFHNGDAATLMQVVQFYTRGGSFPKTNEFNLDPDIEPIGHLAGKPERQRALVAFLKTLTDERVRLEKAPFDHPQLSVPNGSPGDERGLFCKEDAHPRLHTSFCDNFIEIHAVGAGGRAPEGLAPLGTFLNLDPTQE